MTNCKIIYVKNEDMKFYKALIERLRKERKSIITYIKELEQYEKDAEAKKV